MAARPQSQQQRHFILLPLYIYPTPTSWEPLFSAASSHPDLDFLVVVNPANGPGAQLLPDDNYLQALGRLAALSNTKIIGYVHCSYGQRLLEEIVGDISVYRGWLGESRRKEGCEPFHVDGIFIDEVPSSTEFVEYMTHIASAAKSILQHYEHDDLPQPQIQAQIQDSTTIDGVDPEPEPGKGPEAAARPAKSPTTPLPSSAAPAPVVIYNPGVIIDPIFYQAADYVVAFENVSAQWSRKGGSGALLGRLPQPLQQKSVVIAHSSGSPAELARMSYVVRDSGYPGQFITTRPGYTEWCPSWNSYVRELAARGV